MRLDLPTELLPYQAGGFETPDGKARCSPRRWPTPAMIRYPSISRPREAPAATCTRSIRWSCSRPRTTPGSSTPPTRSITANARGARSSRSIRPMPRSRGIAEGEMVRDLERPRGVELPARISERLRPGVAAIPWGWWGKEANVNALTNDTLTDWGGGVAFFDTLVEAALPEPNVMSGAGSDAITLGSRFLSPCCACRRRCR